MVDREGDDDRSKWDNEGALEEEEEEEEAEEEAEKKGRGTRSERAWLLRSS